MEYKNQKYMWAGNFGNNKEKSDILQELFDSFVSNWKCKKIDGINFYDFDQIIKIKEFFNISLVEKTILEILKESKNKYGKPFSFTFSSDNRQLSEDDLTFNLEIKPCWGHEDGAEFDMDITSHQILHFWN